MHSSFKFLSASELSQPVDRPRFRPVAGSFLGRSFLGLWVLFFVVGVPSVAWTQPAGELIKDGDFGTLSGWEELLVPPGSIRELVSENSPFTDIYPSNGKSLKLGNNPEVPSAHTRFLTQEIFGATRKVRFGVDFKILPDPSAAFVIMMFSRDVQIFNIVIRKNLTLNLNITGDSDGRWVLPDKAELVEGEWYQFQGSLDMDDRILRGSIRSESGDAWDLQEHRIAINTEDAEAVIDSVQIRAMAGSGSHASPVLFDNITLQPQKMPNE